MKKITLVAAALSVVVLTAVLACNSNDHKGQTGIAEMPQSAPENRIDRGEYLVNIMGCNDCHTPKVMGSKGPMLDSAYLLAGHPANVPLGSSDPVTLKSWMLFSPTMTAMRGPWGTSFAANITSDETGIGNWTEAQFIKCMREGKLKGMDNARPLLPPMPWENFARASDEDLKAIFAYLKSTRPVENRVPAPLPPVVLSKN